MIEVEDEGETRSGWAAQGCDVEAPCPAGSRGVGIPGTGGVRG